ncbi:hypothetical protein E3T55_04175 [Cryobacterium frigoriphilum]|uniref:DUF559 domain-containing protein n=1 Tax=Cryobacterium frigoriphilum TaxID=1259150 RepID=A0A4R9A8G1_9MICO|nr:hypothetical protein [Cryobacterium frigoriphilum]TFD54189.1 hypothetical protein E3T55_04175 [Cryobacterium frigoriphilum]
MHKRAPLPPSLELAPFTIAEAQAAGLSLKRTRSSDLEHPFYGVIATTGSIENLRDRCRAYSARMPTSSFFSHVTAAVLHGLPLPLVNENDPTLHVTAVRPARAPRAAGVVGHSVEACPRVVLVAGMRVVDPVEAWCELASVLLLDDLIAAGDRLLTGRHPLASPAEITSGVVQYAGHRGAQRLREAELLMRPRVESRRETFLRLFLVRCGFPEPDTNVEIPLPAGTKRVRGDLVYLRYKVLVEYDGEQHRTDDAQYNRDAERLQDLRDAGWIVITVRKGSTPEWVRTTVDAALRLRGWRP